MLISNVLELAGGPPIYHEQSTGLAKLEEDMGCASRRHRDPMEA